MHSGVLALVHSAPFALVLMLIACGASNRGDANEAGRGSANEAGAGTVATLGDLLSVELYYGGAACVDCWRRFRLVAPNNLQVADATGEDDFVLTMDEHRAISALATSDAFHSALGDGANCPLAFDSNAEITVEWAKAGKQTDGNVGRCLTAYRDGEHPFATLYWAFVRLKRVHLECPSFDPLMPWDTTKPPPVRMLCFACGGEC